MEGAHRPGTRSLRLGLPKLLDTHTLLEIMNESEQRGLAGAWDQGHGELQLSSLVIVLRFVVMVSGHKGAFCRKIRW